MNNSEFEEIISASTLLDEEMEALRGGAEGVKVQCGGGVIARCDMGTDDQPTQQPEQK